MPILDDRGRLFGRVNLVDAAAVFLAVMLVAGAYASWWLLRTPPPVVESVSPNRIAPGQADQRVEVRGRNLRPYLHVNIGSDRATYLFESWDRGQVQLPPLGSGTYDLAFFDGAREVGRFPSAVTVLPPGTLEILVRFVARPEVFETVKRAHAESIAAPDPSRLGLISYELIDEAVGTMESLRVPPIEVARAESKRGRLMIVNERVRVPAVSSGDGWQRPDGSALKAGAPFTLNAPSYVLHGEILSIEHAKQ